MTGDPTESQARRFLDGAEPSFALAASELIHPRPLVAKLVADIEAADEPTVFLLTTPSAEGKTTCLMQTAVRLRRNGVRTLWNTGDRLDLEYVGDRLDEIGDAPVCLVVDNAASVHIEAAVTGLANFEGRPVTLLAAARDVDWQLSRRPPVQSLARPEVAVRHVTDLATFSEEDAAAVLAFWDALDEVPSGLRGLPPEERAAELAGWSRRLGGESEIETGGSLLATLLQVRCGKDGIRTRVSEHLRGLVARDEGLGTLLAMLAVADIFEVDGLDRVLLSKAYGLLTGGDRIGPLLGTLASEVADTVVGARGKVYGTRHEVIAKVVVEDVDATVGYEVGTLCRVLIEAAESLTAGGPPFPPTVDVPRMQWVQHMAPRIARVARDTGVAAPLVGCELAERQELAHAADIGFAADTILSKVYAGLERDAAQRARSLLTRLTEYPRWSKGVRSVVQHLSLALSEGQDDEVALFLSLVALSDQISPDFLARDVPRNLAALWHRCGSVPVAEGLGHELQVLLEATTRTGTREWARSQGMTFAVPYPRAHLLHDALRKVASSIEPVLPVLDEELPPIPATLTFTELIRLVRRAAEGAGAAGAYGHLGEPTPEECGQDHYLRKLDEWRSAQAAAGVTVEPLSLYDAQERAMRAFADGRHVVMSTTTGSGKTLVAMWAAYLAITEGRQAVYTAPTRALVNEKFLEWREFFGARRVSLATGDETANPGGPILCCTTEILAEDVVRRPGKLRDAVVVLDEAHYYADEERGLAWQVPLVHLSAQFLLMSATLEGADWLQADLERRTGRQAELVIGGERPIELEYEWSDRPISETTRRASETAPPVYVVAFRRRDARTLARNREVGRRESGLHYSPSLVVASLDPATPFGKLLKENLEMRVAVHHGGMLPYYRRLVERLVSEGTVDIVFGTDTLGVGVNMPIQTVVFSRLSKNHGRARGEGPLTPAEFHQIAGRAGRAGRSERGLVVAVPPDTGAVGRRGRVRMTQRSSSRRDPGLDWTRETFEALQASASDPLAPTFCYSLDFFLGVLAARRGRLLQAVRVCNDHHLVGDRAAEVATQVRADARKVVRALRKRPLDQVTDYGVLRHRSAYGIGTKNRGLLFLAVALDSLFADRRPNADELLVLCEAAESSEEMRIRLRQAHDDAVARGDEQAVATVAPFIEEPPLAVEAREAARRSPLHELGLLNADDYVALSVAKTLLGGTRTLGDLLESGFLDHEDAVRSYLRQLDRWIWKWLPFRLQSDELLDQRVRLRDIASQLESSVLDEMF